MAEAMLKMNRGALFLGALMIMAMFLPSQGKARYKIGCFEGEPDCFADDCKKQCIKANFGIRDNMLEGICEGDPFPHPYNLIDCCCYASY